MRNTYLSWPFVSPALFAGLIGQEGKLVEATIVHISDLHLSNKDAWNNFNSLREAILDLDPKPSLLIASGDFLDHPDSGFLPVGRRLWRRMLRQEMPKTLTDVRTKLEELCRDCGNDCQLVAVPGNHDYRHFGLTAGANHTAGFDKAFPDWRNSLLILKSVRPVAIFCLDSNTNDARVNAARGCVGKAEYSRFQKEFDQLQSSDPVAFDGGGSAVPGAYNSRGGQCVQIW